MRLRSSEPLTTKQWFGVDRGEAWLDTRGRGAADRGEAGAATRPPDPCFGLRSQGSSHRIPSSPRFSVHGKETPTPTPTPTTRSTDAVLKNQTNIRPRALEYVSTLFYAMG